MKDHSWAEIAAACAYERLEQASLEHYNAARNTYRALKRMTIMWEIHQRDVGWEKIKRSLETNMFWIQEWPD